MILSSNITVSDLIVVYVPKTLRSPLTVKFEPVNSNEVETDPVKRLRSSTLVSNNSVRVIVPTTNESA